MAAAAKILNGDRWQFHASGLLLPQAHSLLAKVVSMQLGSLSPALRRAPTTTVAPSYTSDSSPALKTGPADIGKAQDQDVVWVWGDGTLR